MFVVFYLVNIFLGVSIVCGGNETSTKSTVESSSLTTPPVNPTPSLHASSSVNTSSLLTSTKTFSKSIVPASTQHWTSSVPPTVPAITTTPEKKHEEKRSGRRFDTGSFIGGMILMGALIIIFFIVRKFWRGRPNYGKLNWKTKKLFWWSFLSLLGLCHYTLSHAENVFIKIYIICRIFYLNVTHFIMLVKLKRRMICSSYKLGAQILLGQMIEWV